MKDNKCIKITIFLSILFVLGLIQISKDTVYASTIKINKTEVVLFHNGNQNETVKLKLIGTPKKAKWYSSNKKVATVDSNGKVKGVNSGSTKITAKLDGKKYTCWVYVVEFNFSREKYLFRDCSDYKSIHISADASTIMNSKDRKKIKWSCDKSIITLKASDDYCYVTSDGEVTATVTAQIRNIKAKCTVIFRPYTYGKWVDQYLNILNQKNFRENEHAYLVCLDADETPELVFYDSYGDAEIYTSGINEAQLLWEKPVMSSLEMHVYEYTGVVEIIYARKGESHYYYCIDENGIVNEKIDIIHVVGGTGSYKINDVNTSFESCIREVKIKTEGGFDSAVGSSDVVSAVLELRKLAR